MLKRFGIPALALASALAVAAPTFARGRDDFRGHEDFRGRRDFDHHVVVRDRGYHHGGFNFGVGVYANPVPAPSGYYDQYGIWHPYGY